MDPLHQQSLITALTITDNQSNNQQVPRNNNRDDEEIEDEGNFFCKIGYYKINLSY